MPTLKSETKKFRGNSAYFLTPEQWRSDWITIRLRCDYYPEGNWYQNLQWNPHQGGWGRLTRSHKGAVIDERFLRYIENEVMRSQNEVQMISNLMMYAFDVVYRGLDIDFELEPINIVENVIELLLNSAGELQESAISMPGHTPSEFRLATHPDAEWTWTALWSIPDSSFIFFQDFPGTGGGGGPNEPNLFDYGDGPPDVPQDEPEPGDPGDAGNGLDEPAFNLPEEDFDQDLDDGYQLTVTVSFRYDTNDGVFEGTNAYTFTVIPPWNSPSLRIEFDGDGGVNGEGFTEWFLEVSDNSGNAYTERVGSISANYGSGDLSIIDVS